MNTERDIVVKFGGSSLANAEGFIRVGNIVDEDPRRRFIVPSAPGKIRGDENSYKITDLLIFCGKLSFRNYSYDNIFSLIEQRFKEIGEGLGICVDDGLEEIRDGLLIRRETEELSVYWAASRGEWLSGRILAKYLGEEFIDAAEIIKFRADGEFDRNISYELIPKRLRGRGRFIIPGYYGQDEFGRIITFPRGGSDITGAYIAAALNAEVYENWTDTNGILTADNKIVRDARTILGLYYEEMAELGLLGAKVLHPLSLNSVWDKGIPIHVCNTFNPKHPGTWIGDMHFLLEKRLI